MEMNSRFFLDKNAMSMPWVESPFFLNLLRNSDKLTMDEKVLADQFNEKGYVTIDLDVYQQDIDAVVNDMYELINDLPKQAAGYHYNENPRLFEGWKHSNNIRNLSLNKKVLSTLKMLYGREPIPFQTINFVKGTEQPLHSDTIHFHSIPERWLAGVWVALEDMNHKNGPLRYVPGSHRLPVYTFKDINLGVPEFDKQFDHYRQYEEFIEAMIDSLEMCPELFLGKKGTALIWAANLIHGGSKMTDKNLTRLSQVTHYYFEGCEHYYCPMFSDPDNGLIAIKDLSKKRFV